VRLSRKAMPGPQGGAVSRFLIGALLAAVILPASPPVAARAASSPQRGGVVLDGYGGLHPFGGFTLSTAGAPYWPGWDIARALIARNDGAGGWVLDGWGAVHQFGDAKAVPDHLTWPGSDVARALVVTSHDAAGDVGALRADPAPVQGYILDGFGAVHAFGGAPPLRYPAYWPNSDIAAGLDVHVDAGGVPDGLLVLDGFGGLHYSGAYPQVQFAPPMHPGHAVYQRIGCSSDGRLYAVTRFGEVFAMGGQDLSRTPLAVTPFNLRSPAPGPTAVPSALIYAPDTASPAAVLLRPMAPYWDGYADWGRWDILRDIAIGRSDNLTDQPQPVSAEADDALQNVLVDLHTVSLPAPSLRQSMPLDCEAAATAAALRTLGMSLTQAWVFAQLPVDKRAAQTSNGRAVRWGDAWTSFVGNVYGSENNFTGYGVYWQPIVAAVRNAGRTAFGGQGWAVNDLFAELDRGHPVIIWINNSYRYVTPSYWTGWDGAQVPYTLGDHTVLLYGVDFGSGTVHIMDDATGTFRTFSISQFTSFMSTYDNMAVVVE